MVIFETMLRGGIVGFAIAAPVGPIGLLCVRRTLEEGAMTGLVTGFGAASADAVYGLLVALGFGLAASALLGYTAYLQIAGGVLLLFLGIAPLFQKTYYGNQSQIHANETKKISKAFAFGSTFALTLTNPLTILSFIGAIAALSGSGDLSNTKDVGIAISIVVGVFLGSIAWWLTLVGFITAIRSSISPSVQKMIGILSSLLLSGFGIWAIYSGLEGQF